MKILVLGAGVVGTAAAYYLARDGHEVTVIERHPAPARGTSYSNAGLVSPGDAFAWASPGALRTFVKSIFNPDLGVKLRPSLNPVFLSWTWRFLLQCTEARAYANTDVKLRLALYSRECINEISAETGVDFDERRRGIVYFYRDQKSLDNGAQHFRYIGERGLEVEVVDRKRLLEVEPGLASSGDRIVGGIYSPMDQTGDSRMFATKLAQLAVERHGVKFMRDTNVEGLDVEGGRVRAVRTSKGSIACDAAVLSMGPESGVFGRKIGIDLPVYPVKGYTATIPLEDPEKGPTMGGVDEDRYVAYSRLGNRLRLASTAEFAGFDRTHKPSDFARMFRSAHELFPGAIDEKKAELWAGLRPMMPNSVPAIGRTRYDNFYLDTGHGHVGWTMACGSGKFLSDIVAGRKPDIDPQGLLPKA
ncbi:D-amino acid dehydrogenase [Pseudaminobacter soli (ex Li et al. 2025)]|uniref:D-amino acid dehydrogenase n=1 Tax=Pseudaminobacter soli (ex Li et al. 2025) TaxID=1295366 RepID=A0A2P7SCY5_9HYPH|nr:D-amino acid dehydrogenase [Mesorhizobium soli]PSJ60348.1 amino acid dehydrogenase [Mesorhizobium soli]